MAATDARGSGADGGRVWGHEVTGAGAGVVGARGDSVQLDGAREDGGREDGAPGDGVPGDGAPSARTESWEEYVRTSPIMSNVPVTTHPSQRAPLVIPARLSVWNYAVRLLVSLPAVWVIVAMALLMTGGLMWWMILAMFGVATAASVVLARIDERMLRADGHDETVPPWLALVAVVYLARRGTLVYRENSAGYRPLWAHLCVVGGLLLVGLVLTLWSGAMIKLADAWAYYGI